LEPEAKAICKDYAIPTLPSGVATDWSAGVKIAEEIGYPVVMKIVSPDIPHKTDAGAVMMGVRSSNEVREAFDRIIERSLRFKSGASVAGVLVEKQAPTGIEVIVGVSKDPQFGHAIMVGLGGVFVELLKDVAFRITPVTEEEARNMIHEIRAYPLLTGWRGSPPADVETLVHVMTAVSDLVVENPCIEELDLNPVVVYKKGASVLDSRIVLNESVSISRDVVAPNPDLVDEAC
jgi:acetyl-CoA synthetase (ADP-forming)